MVTLLSNVVLVPDTWIQNWTPTQVEKLNKWMKRTIVFTKADELSCFLSEDVYITKPTVTTNAAAWDSTPLWVGKTECWTDFLFTNIISSSSGYLPNIFNIFFLARKMLMNFVSWWINVNWLEVTCSMRFLPTGCRIYILRMRRVVRVDMRRAYCGRYR